MENSVFDVYYRSVRRLTGAAALLVAFAFILTLSCSSGGSDDGDAPPATDGVSLFTPGGVIKQLTGASTVKAASLNPRSDGFFLMVDEPSGAVLIFNFSGQVLMFTDPVELENLLGAPAELGPIDEILLGQQQGHFLSVDQVSGQLIRLQPDGTPIIHATEEQVKAFTRQSTARLKLPRFVLPGSNIAQELVTGDILQIGNSGANIILFVSAVSLSVAAGVTPAQAKVAEWARGPSSRSFYARFDTTSNVVRITESRQTTRYVEATTLQSLFPGVNDLRVTGIIADTKTDTLLLLIADGSRGVALARVSPPELGFTVEEYTSPEEFEEELGPDYNITKIGRLAQSGIAFAIDAEGTRVMTFNSNGVPIVLATADEFVREAGTESPAISIGGELSNFAIIVPEEDTGSLIAVQ